MFWGLCQFVKKIKQSANEIVCNCSRVVIDLYKQKHIRLIWNNLAMLKLNAILKEKNVRFSLKRNKVF